MELCERIILARKRAGMTQEQLGDRLGVSRQAVSKWESGQSNPDIQYVSAMCRALNVSADWLLMGEEGAGETPPAKCPACSGVVTALDNFCPNCGEPLGEDLDREGTFDVILKRPGSDRRRLGEALCRLYNENGFLPPDCSIGFTAVRGRTTSYDANSIMSGAPAILCRGLTYEYVERVMDLLGELATVWVYPSTGEDMDAMLVRRPLSISTGRDEAFVPSEPLSFGGMVFAVIVGVIAAILILSFL